MEALEKYIGTHIIVPGKDSIRFLTRVKGGERHHSGNLVGETNKNPILNTSISKLDFPYGHVEEYLVNTILENVLKRVDGDV